jgi:putative tricarboxylic transport membrane protein
MQRIREAGRFFFTGDRLLVTLFAVLVIFYGAETLTFFRTMSEDVVGPASFPRLLLVLAGILIVVFFVQQRRAPARESDEASDMASEVADLIPAAFMLAYVLLFEKLGFLLATFLFIAPTMRYLGATWPKAVAYSLALTISSFVLFYYALLAELPMGTWVPTEDLLPFLVDIRRAIRS